MNDPVGGTKVSYVEDNGWSGRYGLVEGQYVSLSRKWQGGIFGYYVYYYTDSNNNEVEYDGQRYRKETTNVTRLDVAKSALGGLADQLISQSNSTVKISLETFADNGNNPSEYYGKGEANSFKTRVNGVTASGGTNWTEALEKANALAQKDTSTPTYIVFLSDGQPTYGKNGTGDGTYTSGQFVTDAVDVANKRPSNVLGFYAIYTGTDAYSSMNDFARRTNAAPKGQAIDGSNSAALTSAFSNIVKTINEGISYTNVKITDTKSSYVDYVLPENSKVPNFTYEKNGVAWTDAPSATFNSDNGQVTWDLGNSFKLEKGVTYSVSFEVTLTQAAYDKAAVATGEYEVPTNGDAQLAYSTVVTKSGADPTTEPQDPIAIESPTVKVPTSTLKVSKTWDKKDWKSVKEPSNLEVQIKQDGKDYKTVTLNESNGWKADVVVAAGPRGHKYSVVETNAPADWDVKLPDGVQLQGLTSQPGNQAITNTIKTNKLTITKSVSGNFGDTSRGFEFGLTSSVNAKVLSKDVNLAPDGSFTLKNGQSLVVELPYGATYQVVEHDPTKGTNDTVPYTTAIAVGDSGADTDVIERKASSPTGGITKDTAITYTNYREVTPDVGVDLGSGAPYVAVVGGVGIAGVIWMALKRRNSQEI